MKSWAWLSMSREPIIACKEVKLVNTGNTGGCIVFYTGQNWKCSKLVLAPRKIVKSYYIALAAFSLHLLWKPRITGFKNKAFKAIVQRRIGISVRFRDLLISVISEDLYTDSFKAKKNDIILIWLIFEKYFANLKIRVKI